MRNGFKRSALIVAIVFVASCSYTPAGRGARAEYDALNHKGFFASHELFDPCNCGIDYRPIELATAVVFFAAGWYLSRRRK